MKISGNKILITGGASGIGRGMTERFMKEGNVVIVCSRREVVLHDLKAEYPDVITGKYDLSEASERKALFDWISNEHPDLNVLVNNAGIQQIMNISDEDFIVRTRAEIAINVEAPLHLSNLFLRLKKIDAVLNVTSGLAYSPMSRMPVYCATKAFMHSFTLSLRHLLKERNVEVIEIIPPALNTDLGGKGLHDYAPPVSAFIETLFEQLRAGNNEISWGFSEAMTKAGPEELKQAFDRMNNQRH